jgi:hypothetical protein
VLDNLFPICTLKHKEIIASALSPREAQLNANKFGKFLSTKYGLMAFKRNQTDWSRAMEEGNKKRKKALDQIVFDMGLDLGEISSPVASKKSKKGP